MGTSFEGDLPGTTVRTTGYVRFTIRPCNRAWSADNKVTNVFTDKQGNLWLGSYGNGLEKISFNTNHFHLLTAAPDDTEFPGREPPRRMISGTATGNIRRAIKRKLFAIISSGFLSLSSKHKSPRQQGFCP